MTDPDELKAPIEPPASQLNAMTVANSLPPQPSSFRRAHPEVVVACSTFLLASTALAVLAFRNFSAALIVVLQATLALVPIWFLLRRTLSRSSLSGQLSPVGVVRAISGALALVLFQSAAIVGGPAEYFSNFAHVRLGLGAGYHVDTAFHVAIIQNILANGRPSTGQHLQPFLAYHWLSHYLDAAIVKTFSLDAWDSYALLYYLKSTPVVLAFVSFVERCSRAWSPKVFWFALTATFPAFSASWYPTASHSQWVPVLVLLLAGPWIAGVVRAQEIDGRQLVKLSAIVVVLTLGKGSIGVAFVVFIATSLVLQRRMTRLVVGSLAAWALGLLWWARLAGAVDRAAVPSTQRIGLIDFLDLVVRQFEESTGLIFAVVGMVFLLIGLRRAFGGALPMAAALCVTTVAVGVVSVLSASGFVFYYFLGLAYVTLVMVVSLVFSEADRAAAPTASQIAVMLALAVSPWTLEAQYSPYQSLPRMVNTALSLNDTTYRWHNEGRVQERHVTLWRLATGSADLAQRFDSEPAIMESLRDELEATLLRAGVSRSSALLFIPEDVFADLEVAVPGGRMWSSGLLVTATTGMILVHGVHDDTPAGSYGFPSYARAIDEARRRTTDDAAPLNLCQFGKAVLIVRDVDPIVVEATCVSN